MTAGTRALPRTWLFVPASDERKVAKACSSSADVVILDLEDGVALREKPRARKHAAVVLRDPRFDEGRLALRVNAVDTSEFAEDMTLAKSAPAAILLVPKVEAPTDVVRVAEMLGADSQTRVVACLETPRGVTAAAGIAEAHPALMGLLFGSGDYCAALGVRESVGRTELDYPRAHVAMVASAAGLIAVDSPFFQALDDLEALRADVLRGRQFGYHAKAAIHPAHLTAIEDVLTPDSDQIAWANAVLAAHEAGLAAGRGATRARDFLVDEPMVAQARRILASPR
jgi:citrate lyase beta subunit